MALLAALVRRRLCTSILVVLILCISYHLLLSSGEKKTVSSVDINDLLLEVDVSHGVKEVSYKQLGNQTIYEDKDKAIPFHDQQTLDYYQNLWQWAQSVVTGNELFPESAETDMVIQALAEAKILSVDVLNANTLGKYESGTSQKWLVSLEGGQKAVMKLMWEKKGRMKDKGLCNYGFEMPSSEIAAFHLHRVLGFRNTPYVSGRRVNLHEEILPQASPAVVREIQRKEGKKLCVIGQCYLCKAAELLCTPDGTVEVSLAYWINQDLEMHTYPPDYMPYSTPSMNEWKKYGLNNSTYCNHVRKNIKPYNDRRLFYDLFDFAVLDTLMYHYDSKHYTMTVNNLTVRLDHGRAFCDSSKDEIGVFLAPLTQCCTLRKSTWLKLKQFEDNSLSEALRRSLSNDPLSPVLEPDWYVAIDRRYDIIMDTIEQCATAKGGLEKVLVDDS